MKYALAILILASAIELAIIVALVIKAVRHFRRQAEHGKGKHQ